MSVPQRALPASKDYLLDDVYSLLEKVTREGQQSYWTPDQLSSFGHLIVSDPGGTPTFTRLC